MKTRTLHPTARLLPIVLLALFGAAPAGAQVAETWLHATPIEALPGWRSARLLAMGDLRFAADDRSYRFNSFDYGGNPAGLLGARDTSWVEQGSEYADFYDEYYGQSHSAILRRSGFRGAFDGTRNWALGAEFTYSSVLASRHDEFTTQDNARFMRDFDIPFASSSQPVLGDRTFGAAVRYPAFAVNYARRFRSWVTLGLRYGFRDESEDRRLRDPYDLDASAVANEYAGGAVFRLPKIGDNVTLSAFGRYVSNKVKANSESPLNDDEYDWDRPEVGYGAQIIVRTGLLKAIVDGRHRSYDGEQIARVNWAPQFFLNPFPSEIDPDLVFRRRWSSFLSGLRHNEGSAHWRIDVPGLPMHVGGEYALYRDYQWIRPNPIVFQMALPLDVRRLGYRAGGGVSFDLTEGGAVATEVRIARDFRDDLTGALPDIVTSTLSYHFGGEFHALPRLAVRGGFVLLRQDPDRRDGLAPNKGVQLTAGLGYMWDAIDSQIDLTGAHEHYRFAPADPSGEIGYGDRLILTLTRLF